MNKQSKLNKIAREIALCKICKRNKIGLPVPGEGNPNAKVVFIGEAPGKTEAKTGRPFVGRSGKFLRHLINSTGLDDAKDVYITSPVKYLPKHGTPTPQEVAHGKIHLDQQLAVIRPKIIVLLGSVAALALLNKKLPVLLMHGKLFVKNQRTYFLTLHPAAGIRFQKFKKVIASDFKKIKQIIKSDVFLSANRMAGKFPTKIL